MKKPILIAALAVIGSQILFSSAAQSYDRDDWNRNVVAPYGYNNGYNNPYNNGFYNNGQGAFIRHIRHERREARHEAMRRWDNRLNRWF
jgi:hypothetical protein